MPPPPSYLDITALPYTTTVTVADFNAGTYGGTANQVWFRYVATDPIGFGSYTTSAGNFTPRVRLYESDGSTLINEFNTSYGWWVYLLPDTYYIRITRSAGGATNSDFDVTAEGADVIDSPQPGNIVINDDTTAPGTYPTTAIPATVWEIDGTFLGIMPEVPAGETGDALPNGISLWHDRFGSNGAANTLSLNDASGGYISTVTLGESFGSFFPCICHTDTTFYVLNRNTNNVYSVSDAGVVTGPLANVSLTATVSAFGISKDASIGYWAEGTASAAIHQHDMNTDTPMADLYTIVGLAGNGSVALTALNLNPGEILVLSDDSVVTFCLNTSTTTASIVHISAAGALINKYDYSSPTQVDHIAYAPTDPDGIHVWLFVDSPLGNNGRFGYLDLATGTLSPFFNRTLFSGGENLNVSSEIFGPSASCTMVTLGLADAGTGNLVVIKEIIGSDLTQRFDFVAGGGLDPAAFELGDGESQSYLGLTPGSGYSVEETPVPAGWTVSYSVSNGSPIDALLVEADATTTVTVTNSNNVLGRATELPIRVVLRTGIVQ